MDNVDLLLIPMVKYNEKELFKCPELSIDNESYDNAKEKYDDYMEKIITNLRGLTTYIWNMLSDEYLY